MCTHLSSSISQLLRENDEARALNVGVRPSSTLQQAPWWFKIPKQFTWVNLPDGVNENQAEKDIAKICRNRRESTEEVESRTPSPEPERMSRKRKRRDEEREQRREETLYYRNLAIFDDSNNWSIDDFDRMGSLLRAVSDEAMAERHFAMPRGPSRPVQPFSYHPSVPQPMPPLDPYMGTPRGFTRSPDPYWTPRHFAPSIQPPWPTISTSQSLLPRPPQMPYPYPSELPYGQVGNYPPIHFPTNDRRSDMGSDYPPPQHMDDRPDNTPAFHHGPFTERPTDTPPHPPPGPLTAPTIQQDSFQRTPETQTPRTIMPRRVSPPPPPVQPPEPPKLTPIQPNPNPPPRKSISPDVSRIQKRTHSLLPKLPPIQPQQPPPSQPQPQQPQQPQQSQTPQSQPLPISGVPSFNFTDPSTLIHGGVPSPAPRMGRFQMLESGYFPLNPKIAISRKSTNSNSNGVASERAQLKITPAPGGKKGEGKRLPEIRIKEAPRANGTEGSDVSAGLGTDVENGPGSDGKDKGKSTSESEKEGEMGNGEEVSSKETETERVRRSHRSASGRKK
jgi:hypothetical protein